MTGSEKTSNFKKLSKLGRSAKAMGVTKEQNIFLNLRIRITIDQHLDKI